MNKCITKPPPVPNLTPQALNFIAQSKCPTYSQKLINNESLEKSILKMVVEFIAGVLEIDGRAHDWKNKPSYGQV